MWVYLATWLVQDGEVSELRPGDELAKTGLRVGVDDVQSAVGRDAIAADDGSSSGRVRYAITGTVGMKISYANGWQDVASVEFVTTSQLIPIVATLALERPRSGEGQRATVSGSLSVIPEYEFEEFGLPDVRSRWQVQGLRAEDSEVVLDAQGIRTAGRVRAYRELDRMRQWEDDADPERNIMTSYLVDLEQL